MLLLGDTDRALARLKSSPPSAIVLFGASVGDRVVEDFHNALDATHGKPVAVVAVLTDAQMSLRRELGNGDARGVVLPQTAKLRELREGLEKAISAN